MEKRLFELIIMVKKKCVRTEETIREKLGLSPGEFHGLLAIQPGEKLPGLEFAERMDFSASRASRIINRLVNKGYMILKPAQADRRSIETALTPEGEKMRAVLYKEMSECEKRITSQLKDEDVEEIKNALMKLTGVM